jgi:hypothetical protein
MEKERRDNLLRYFTHPAVKFDGGGRDYLERFIKKFLDFLIRVSFFYMQNKDLTQLDSQTLKQCFQKFHDFYQLFKNSSFMDSDI